MPSHAELPLVSVIVPAYRSAATLGRCLEGLQESDLPCAAWELIVVDDGCDDGSHGIAAQCADRVVRISDGPRGPAYARNAGAAVALGDILVFVDADVVVAGDALRRLVTHLAPGSGVTAVFGAYDETPADPGFVSQYRNLLHRWVHSTSAGDASTFWAACGAVRHAAFHDVGQFDDRRYPRPQIEDVELGYRLHDAGHRIVLDPAVRCTHLKRWTLRGMLRVDLVDRAIPWMELLVARRETVANGPLNLKGSEKLLTAVAGFVLLSAFVAMVARDARWLAVSAACIAIIIGQNMPFLLWLARLRGPWFALRTIPLRLLFYVECALAAGYVILSPRLQARPHRAAGDEPQSGTERTEQSA